MALNRAHEIIQQALSANQQMVQHSEQDWEDLLTRRATQSPLVLNPVSTGTDLGTNDTVNDAGGMNPALEKALSQMMAASGGQVSIGSGYRSVQEQQELWEAALEKYGDPEIADNWVARPGTSNHGRGTAADLRFTNDAARQWAHENAARFGLYFPMDHEPWHIEPVRR